MRQGGASWKYQVPQLLHIAAEQHEGLWQAGELGPGIPSAVRNRAVGWKEQKEQGQASGSLGKLSPSEIKSMNSLKPLESFRMFGRISRQTFLCLLFHVSFQNILRLLTNSLIIPYLENEQTNNSGINPNSLEAWPHLPLSVSISYCFGCLSLAKYRL